MTFFRGKLIEHSFFDTMLTVDDEKIIPYRTTYQVDYQKYAEYKQTIYKYENDRHEKTQKLTPPPTLTNHETFAPWKNNKNVPFDLLLKPKEIVNTHPKNPLVEVKSLLKEQTEEIIKTRPRVYMAPACCLDDVPNADMRKLLIEQTYSTEWRKAEKEATENFKPVEPHIAEIGEKDNVQLEIDLYKPLGKKFRIQGKQWDEDQHRSYCDPTKEFWLIKNPPVVCGACVNPLKNIVNKDTKQNIQSLITTEKLRYPHDKVSPSFAGYKPMLPNGVPLSKSQRSIAHPLLSTYQAINEQHRFLCE